MGQKRGYNVVLFQSRSPRYPSALATTESKTWRYRVSRGIKKPWQINHSQAGIPLPQLTDIVLWSLCQQGLISKTGMRPTGKCLWNYQRGAGSMSACMHTNVSSSQLKQYFIFLSIFNLHAIYYLFAWLITHLLSCMEGCFCTFYVSP